MQVASGRASTAKLDAAINELNRLKSEHQASLKPAGSAPEKSAPTRMCAKVSAIMADANSSMVSIKKSGILAEIARLSKDRADLSNMLHTIPKDQPCPELTSRILDIHHNIENLWDKQKFLERNQHDGPDDAIDDQQIVKRSLESINTKAELTVELQKLREKKSKLKAKLGNPRTGIAKRTEWENALAQVEAEIEEATTKRALI